MIKTLFNLKSVEFYLACECYWKVERVCEINYWISETFFFGNRQKSEGQFFFCCNLHMWMCFQSQRYKNAAMTSSTFRFYICLPPILPLVLPVFGQLDSAQISKVDRNSSGEWRHQPEARKLCTKWRIPTGSQDSLITSGLCSIVWESVLRHFLHGTMPIAPCYFVQFVNLMYE